MNRDPAALSHQLDLPELLRYLKGYAQTSEVAAACCNGNWPVAESTEEVETRWKEQDFFLSYYASQGHWPALCEPATALTALRRLAKGSVLTADELHAIRNLATAADDLSLRTEQAQLHRPAADLWGPLPRFPTVKAAIDQILDDRAQIRDSASPVLADSRDRQRQTLAQLQRSARRLHQSNEWRRYLAHEGLSEREGRLVVAVRADAGGRLAAEVIERSPEGHLIYVEPEAFREPNRSRRHLRQEEERELLRILQRVSRQLVPHSEPLVRWATLVVTLDRACTLAQWAHHTGAVTLKLTKPGRGFELQLRDAVHPLLLLADPQGAVRNDWIYPAGECGGVVISGPNAGGKTMTLKTIGLFQQMARCGLRLTCAAESSMPLWQHLFVEIGDGQDVRHNLSTFAAHLAWMHHVLTTATPNDLILVDELCSGTQPRRGEALACAILEEWLAAGIAWICTSHYDGVKTFAAACPSVQVASMQFDLQQGRPTYRYLPGVPGHSYAFELAFHHQLPSTVLARAHSRLAASEHEHEALSAELRAQLAKAEQRQQEAAQAIEAARQTELRWKTEVATLQRERHQLLAAAREQTRDELTRLRQKIADLQAQTRSEQGRPPGYIPSPTTKLKALAAEITSQLTPRHNLEPTGHPSLFAVGDQVWIPSLRETGRVIRVRNGNPQRLTVETKRARLDLSARNLRPHRNTAKEEGRNQAALDASPKAFQPDPTFMPMLAERTLDIRGLSREEAETHVLDHIDRALRSQENYVWIIHGHGSGILREHVRALSQSVPQLTIQHRAAPLQDGGNGVTLLFW